ncbi:MAG: gas vesicle protein [Jatrophihabitans sp.]|nr:gas vesicle protein [Jatrophihabitans sp.]
MTAVAEKSVETPATSLVDLLDRLLGAGVVLSGDVTISLAGVDLVTVKLRALVMSVREAQP